MGGKVRENANVVAEVSATVVVEFESFDEAKAYYDSSLLQV